MDESKSGLYIVAIVAVIAVVAMVVMITSAGNESGVIFSSEDATGQVHAVSISGHTCRQHLGGHMVNGVCRGDPRKYPTNGGTPIDPNLLNVNNIDTGSSGPTPDNFVS